MRALSGVSNSLYLDIGDGVTGMYASQNSSNALMILLNVNFTPKYKQNNDTHAEGFRSKVYGYLQFTLNCNNYNNGLMDKQQ